MSLRLKNLSTDIVMDSLHGIIKKREWGVVMTASIHALEEKRKYLIGRIEYLEATVAKYKTNEGALEEGFCKEQIELNEHSIAGYRSELLQVESELAVLIQ